MSQILIKLKRKLKKPESLIILDLLAILLLMSLLLLRGIGDVNIAFPDAARLLMDGVFIYDFLIDLPITNLYQYTTEYYAQYPALSIGYRPPFYPLIEAIFYSVFGIEIWSSRLATVLFAVLGVSCWFDLLRRTYNNSIAISSSLLLVTTPFFCTWGWYTLTDLPVASMMMATAYFFFRYSETEKLSHLYSFTFVFCISIWTKQTAAFQVIWFVLFLIYKRQLLTYLKRKEIWFSITIMVIIITPLIIITLWLGKENMAQSVGSSAKIYSDYGRLSWDNLTWLIRALVKIQITPPVFILSLVGAVLAIYKRDKKFIFFGLLIASVYVFFTYILAKTPRYTIFWMPAFTLLAVLPLYYFQKSKVFYHFSWILIAAISIFQIYKSFEKPQLYASGYDVAAQYVLDNCQDSPTVLFDGYNNGYFTYFMRALDPKRSMYVLRGDKILSSSSIYSNHNTETYASTTEDIQKIIDNYGFACIVVENNNPFKIKIHTIFRDYLATGPFQLIHEITVNSNRPVLQNQTIKIYRYLQLKPPTAEFLIIKLPVVGKELKIPYKKLLNKQSRK